jgi:hypothetical protein
VLYGLLWPEAYRSARWLSQLRWVHWDCGIAGRPGRVLVARRTRFVRVGLPDTDQGWVALDLSPERRPGEACRRHIPGPGTAPEYC